MKLTLVSPYLSITSFATVEIPDFTVVTGVNGAGKTHLLRAIAEGHVKCSSATNPKSETRYYDWTNLLPQASANMRNPSAVAAEELSKQAEAVRRRNVQKLVDLSNKLGFGAIWPGDRWELLSATDEQLSLAKYDSDLHSLNVEDQGLIASAKARFGALANALDAELAKAIQPKTRLTDLVSQLGPALGHPCLLTRKGLASLPFRWTQDDLFKQSFADMFQQYFDLMKQNRKARIESNPEYLSDDAFCALHGEPPWHFVNKCLAEAGLDFAINNPNDYSVTKFEPAVSKKSTGTTVQFSSLSSGEQVLMSFAFCLYYSSDRRQVVQTPKLLLLDEVDAPLHPSMAKGLIETISKHIVGTHGVKVILTTHSPSTIAVAPPAAIHLMVPQLGLKAVGKRQSLSSIA